MLAYLLASLPTPRLGVVPEIRPEAFLEACRGFVSDERWSDLAAVLGAEVAGAGDGLPAGRPSASEADAAGNGGAVPKGAAHDPAARAWADAADQVQDALVLERSARAKRDPMPHLRRPEGFRVDVIEAVSQAFELPHPGARERALDQLRWRLADELTTAAPAGFGALLARAVQLRLAWRWAGWDAEAGWVALEAALRRVEERHG